MARYRINQVKTEIDVPMEDLPGIVARKLGINESDIKDWEIRRKSIDSRKKPHIQYVYTAHFVTEKKLNLKRNKNLSIVEEWTEPASTWSSSSASDGTPKAASSETPKPTSDGTPKPGNDEIKGRIVVVGAGPAGLFAAMELAAAGYEPLMIERGPAMEERAAAVDRFKENRVLDPEANMLFGEGGAGTFSDGKLTTGIKDGLIRRVLSEFRDAGAGDEIMYLAKPHIGTDVLRTVIVNIRKKIEELGGEIRFNTRLDSFELSGESLIGVHVVNVRDGTGEYIDTNALVLATGHSARDTFDMLNNSGAFMEQKPFSIGVRMEHPQVLIDEAQYGAENRDRFAGDAVRAENESGLLPPADYKISYHASNGRGVYSFCMCPGGEVVVCSTKDGELCVNGMSSRRRSSGFANSGILCDVRPGDFADEGFDPDDVLAGVRFQEKYERLAFENGGGDFTAPSCSMKDFVGEQYYLEKYGNGGNTQEDADMQTNEVDAVKAKSPCNSLSAYTVKARCVYDSLPNFAAEAIREAVPEFAKRIKGYDSPEAVVTAVETRSSSPVRILRNEEGESNINGIYPCGEGAGYAGGITSAACDGIRAAHHLIERFAVD